jgi:opacity protein-like surface antigen
MQTLSSTLGLAFSSILIASVCATARAQTDISVNLLGNFGGTTTYADGEEHQGPAHAAGALFELRHISSPLVGYEATYSYNRANQVFTYTGPTPVCTSPSGCVVAPEGVSANAHQLTGDWLFSARVAKFRPFALAGIGVLFTEPTSSLAGTNTVSSTSAVYVYGAGLDWRIQRYLGLRFQYRGSVFKAPNITTGIANNNFTYAAQPMIGAYYKF